MPISIDWATKVINIPQSYLEDQGGGIYKLYLNQFRLDLKNLEDSEAGMPFLDTHRHNTEVTVGGVTLARVIEIINGYTVTFEDGQYAVNFVGANTNVADVTNVNQVSVRPSNSAGLVTSAGIEALEYEGGVTINAANGEAGTIYPIGTPRRPVNNLTDAKIIMNARGFDTIYIAGNLTLGATDNVDGFILIGENHITTTLTLTGGCSTEGTEFKEMTITGAFDGKVMLHHCKLDAPTGFLGDAHNCILNTSLGLGGSFGDVALFLECWLGSSVVEGVTTIDMNGDGPTLNMRGHSGAIKIINKSGASKVAIDFLSGRIIIDSTVTAGTFYLRGVAEISEDNSTGTTVYSAPLTNPATVADQVWDEAMVEHILAGSFGKAEGSVFTDVELIKKIESGRWKIINNQMIFYDDDDLTPLITFNLFDKAGQPAEDDVYERDPE